MVYSEADLIIPVLNHLLLNKEAGLKTSDLIRLLSEELEISGKDAEILKDRKDTHFSQKVRNLVSHRTFIKKGLITYEKIGKDGLHKITNLGESYLLNNINNFNFIVDNNFDENQRKEIIDKDYSNLVIEEGFTKFTQIKTKARSRKLVEIAKDYYSKDGKIYCAACNFNFEDFYGEIGKGYIEIHHIEPIFAKEDNFEQLAKEALSKVVPVCANCHRIIHRQQDKLLSISSLQELVSSFGKYQK
jgi:hypothetical protein